MPTLVKEVRLIMAENGIDPDTGKPRNNYKYWNAKLYDDDQVHAEWGRVGCANPDSGVWPGGDSYLSKKVREKEKKGYTHQKTIGEAVAASGSGTVVKNTDLHSIAWRYRMTGLLYWGGMAYWDETPDPWAQAPVYTGKGLSGVLDWVRTGRIARGSTVAFIHTGGTPEVFAYNQEIMDRLRQAR